MNKYFNIEISHKGISDNALNIISQHLKDSRELYLSCIKSGIDEGWAELILPNIALYDQINNEVNNK